MVTQSEKEAMYRNPEDLTDSEEDIHPNISARSYHHFIRAEREKRLNELKAKITLTEEEVKEMNKLIYKTLPVDREVGESSFLFYKDSENTKTDSFEQLIYLIEHNEITDFIKFLDENDVNLDDFENLTYYNLVSAIKDNNNELGYILCKIALVMKWARLYGREYLFKLKNFDGLDKLFMNHYNDSVEALKNLNNK